MKKKFVIAAVVTIVVIIALPFSVLADGTVNWTNHGADNLPCTTGMHVVFTPGGSGDTVSGATLYVNGGDGIAMSKHANGSWWADVYGSFDSTLVMYVDYVGDIGSGQAGVQLSHCLEGTPPTPTDPTPTLPTPTDPTPTLPTPTDPTPTLPTPTDPTPTLPTPTVPTGTPIPPPITGGEGGPPRSSPVLPGAITIVAILTVVGLGLKKYLPLANK